MTKLNIMLDEDEVALLRKILGDVDGGGSDAPESLLDAVEDVNTRYVTGQFNKRTNFINAFEVLDEHLASLSVLTDALDLIIPQDVERLEFGVFLNRWRKMCAQYEAEKNRTTPLSPGECMRAAASAMDLSLRNAAFEMSSPHGMQYDPFGRVLSRVAGLLYTLASYHGCERAPIIPWDDKPGPADSPWSMPT